MPIYQTSSYVFESCAQAAARFDLSESGNIYTRLTNPTQDAFERRMAALEGGTAALAVASGAAALAYTFQNLAHAGERIVSAKNIYGGTFNLLAHTLPEYGIDTTFANFLNPEAIEEAITEDTRCLFLRRSATPIPISQTSRPPRKSPTGTGSRSWWTTPSRRRTCSAPSSTARISFVHSATKFIGGHGTSLGGVIVDGGTFDWKASGKFPSLTEPNPSYHGVSFTDAAGPAAFVTKVRAVLLRDMGAALSPFHSFLFLQGLETLSLRVERHVENALRVVEYLHGHPQVERVNHPSVSEDPQQQRLYRKYFPNGGGSIFTFEIKGGAREAQRFIDHLELFSLLANVADVKSLVIHPATTTHSQCTEAELREQGIRPNTIRLSIGTEHIDDILEDLEEAFRAVK